MTRGGDLLAELSLHQLCRMVECWRIETERQRAWTVDDAADACDVERTQAGRFIRSMQRVGLIERAPALPRVPGQPRVRLYRYQVTVIWLGIAARLRAENRLPGRCCLCGDRSVPFPFLRRWFCADCLMVVTCGRHGTLCGQIVFPAIGAEGGAPAVGGDPDDDV